MNGEGLVDKGLTAHLHDIACLSLQRISVGKDCLYIAFDLLQMIKSFATPHVGHDHVLIIHEEYGPTSLLERFCFDFCRLFLYLLLGHRKVYIKLCALSLFAVCGDDPAVGLDDPIYRRQTQSGAPSHLLRGEEGLEDPLTCLGVHPAACISYGDPYKLARSTIMVPRINLIQENIGHCQIEMPPGHSLPGVDKEVEEYPLELPLVHLNGPEL
jgi:hypothetical protein